MSRGNIFPDDMPHLKGLQLPDHPGSEHEADEKGRQDRVDGPEGNVTKDIEKRKGVMKRVEQMIEHRLTPSL
jgi:hypothetical protein